MTNEYVRYCPDCDKEISYASKYSLKYANEAGSSCLSCSTTGKNNPFYGKAHSEETKRMMGENQRDYSGENNPFYGRVHSDESKKKMRETTLEDFERDGHPRVGTKHSEESIQRMRGPRPSVSGENNPMFGKDRPDLSDKNMKNLGKSYEEIYGIDRATDIRRNLRLSHLARLEKRSGPALPNYNPAACLIIEEYGKKHGYNFQHAENGGEFHIKELGYWVDGYDEDNNVVIEYYEKWHKRKSARDALRRREIIEYLGCKFIELKEWEVI